ncbi:MAG: DUF4293 domain-containing protein [Bacteroidota bacterium]
MLQRIQTVWLLLAGVAAFLTLKLHFYSGVLQQPEGTASISYAKQNGMSPFWLMLVTVAIGLIAFITIGLFKNRTVQLRLCVLGIVLEALLIFLYYQTIKSKFVPGQGEYSLTTLLHSLIVLFFVLAARSINKDQKLIKESDRLR